jgi:hypothetical protein
MANARVNLGLGNHLGYDRDRLWYGLTHMLKAYDVLPNTQCNTSMIVRGGDHERSWWEL